MWAHFAYAQPMALLRKGWIRSTEDLNDLERIVQDKRNDKRSDAKKERRNRHYVKVLIKQQLKEDDLDVLNGN